MSTSRKPILCLDFDGVLHSCASGWQGAAVVSDPPVPGAMEALAAYTTTFRMTVYSSRSKREGGVVAMLHWLAKHLVRELGGEGGGRVFEAIKWPTSKPPAVVTLDDRAITFRGRWPEPEDLAASQPWNKGVPKRGFAFLGETDIGRCAFDCASGGEWWSVQATITTWAIVDEGPQQRVADVRRVGYGPTLERAMVEAVRMSVSAKSAQLRRGTVAVRRAHRVRQPFRAGAAREEGSHRWVSTSA